ncbi:DUF742 domain-containing protein [Streptomyces sp. NPDC001401]|uniref:DUF742 domain-containing protein n=1 Tax=Streptomyces sp. NPDC001401 TaxID=3364570 RepID=UPI00369581D0
MDETTTIVRLYAMTNGVTKARHTLSLHTVLGIGHRTPRPGLSAESVRLVELCRQRQRPLTELAGLLALPVTLVRVLVSDLIDAGVLTVPKPDRRSANSDVQLLLAVAAGIKRRHPNARAKAG